ncbi:hypothetical protein WJX74_010109 [Apatococcus lobatus]|uniref:UV radiation resistance-associated gene protein n=1 Tax=Apatococcus lobatus TaxID=904363 RepID=A0AAW1RFV4_9CHLO
MTEAKQHWQPQLRLRHLESIQAWNLPHAAHAANVTVHYALWSRAVPQGETWPLLHVSEEAHAASLQRHTLPSWSAASRLPDALVHSPASSQLHLHVYLTALPSFHASGNAQPAQDQPQANAEGSGPQRERKEEKGLLQAAGEQASQHKHPGSFTVDALQGHCPVIAEHLSSKGKDQVDTSKHEEGQDIPDVHRQRGFEPLVPGSEQHAAVQPCLTMHRDCAKEGFQLLLAASFDLNALAPLGPDLAACPATALPPNAILLELSGAGFFAIPMGAPIPIESSAGPKGSGGSGLSKQMQQQAQMARTASAILQDRHAREADRLLQSLRAKPIPFPSSVPEGTTLAPSEGSRGSGGGSLLGSSPTQPSHTRRRSDGARTPSRPSTPKGQQQPSTPLVEMKWEEWKEAQQSLAGRQRSLQQTLDRRKHLEAQLDKAAGNRETGRFRGHQLQEANAAAAAEALAADQEAKRANNAKSRDELTRRILGNQAAALKTVANALQAADRRLGDAISLLEREGRQKRMRAVHRALVARRCRLVAAAGAIYGLGPRTVEVVEAPALGHLDVQLEQGWWAGRPASALPLQNGFAHPSGAQSQASSHEREAASPHSQNSSRGVTFKQEARLVIAGMELDPAQVEKGLEGLLGWDKDLEDEQNIAVALGYVAHLVDRLAAYLDVPLRYPIHPGQSVSAILEHGRHCGSYRRWRGEGLGQGHLNGLPVSGRERADDSSSPLYPPAHPLCLTTSDPARFGFAMYLLSQDVAQLLSAHGMDSTSASYLLHNLFKLQAAAASAIR